MEYQYSDFYVQLAAHFLLEVYQETGAVYCYICYYVLFNVAHLQATLVSYGTQPLGWKKSRSNAQMQLMLLKIYGELGEFLYIKHLILILIYCVW